MEETHDDFYRNMRTRVEDWLKTEEGKKSKWTEYLLLTPDLFHLLIKLMLDKDVPPKSKVKLGIAIAYFVSPIDLIPEMLTGVVGYVDDIAVAAYALNSIVNETSEEVLKKHWAGQGDILESIRHILEVADDMVGAGLMKKIKDIFKEK
jgi:uncharacterized membrane protein YkvA (DUF1232 family)